MPFRGICLLVCVLCVTQIIAQQNTRSKKKPNPRKDALSLRMIEDLKEQLENLSQEVALLTEKQALQTVCLKGTKINLKCVLAFSHAKTYHEANEDCISQGGTLSTPQTDDENDALYDYVRKTLGNEVEIWLGINDLAVEGKWVDMTSSSISYKNWETEITTQPLFPLIFWSPCAHKISFVQHFRGRVNFCAHCGVKGQSTLRCPQFIAIKKC